MDDSEKDAYFKLEGGVSAINPFEKEAILLMLEVGGITSDEYKVLMESYEANVN